MNIRMAQLDDIETLFEIRTSVVENHLSREEMAELDITPKSIAEMLRTDCRAWIAEINHRSIGFSIVNAPEKTIFGLFVLPEFEGQGVGRALMQVAENWLWSKGIEEIWLLTGNDPNLRAYGFYLHLGWIRGGVESDGYFKGAMKFIKSHKNIFEPAKHLNETQYFIARAIKNLKNKTDRVLTILNKDNWDFLGRSSQNLIINYHDYSS